MNDRKADRDIAVKKSHQAARVQHQSLLTQNRE